MYAVIQSGSRQYRVQPGQVLEVDRLPAEVGEQVVFDRVLLSAADDQVRVGDPIVSGAKVVGQVLNHYRTRKVPVLKYKRSERYRRRSSQRRALTRVRIHEIIA